MKRLLFFLGLFISLLDLSAQPSSQIKIQLGTIKSFVPSHESHKFAYEMHSHYKLNFSNLGIEFERFSNSRRSWFICGMKGGLDHSFSINESSFQTINSNRGSGGGTFFFRLHGGLNNKIGKPGRKGHKWSLLYGGGLVIIPANNGSTGTKDPDIGTTINGSSFISPYNNWVIRSGYFRVVNSVGKLRIVPLAFFGPRFTTFKKNGISSISMDATFNWSFSHYNSYEIPYTLDGISAKDEFKINGVYAQLNFNIPVHTFKIKKPS